MKQYYAIKPILIATFLSATLVASAQFVDYGSDPACIKWRKINTEHYSVIYPAGNERQAHQYAILLEAVYPHERETMNSKREARIPVVIHPYNMLSNGMVAWAPRRMELLPAPDVGKSFQSPDLSLVTHESRHVAQLNRLNQGVLRPFHFIFGEATMGVSSVLVPQWLFEGDAVVTETALSSSGRGRQADFLMRHRAQASTGKFFSLDKWFMGSYKDNTGDFYALGYAMSSHARVKFGADVWNNVLNDVSLMHGLPPFAVALRRNTGLTPKQLFKSTFDSLLNATYIDNNSLAVKPEIVPTKNRRYASYLSPVQTKQGIVSVKNSLDDITELVVCDTAGREKRLAYLGNINSKISVRDDYIYWTEYVSGIRWTHKNYSVVKRYSMTTGKVSRLTPRRRYLFPAPSETGDRIAVYEPLVNGENRITVIDTAGNRLYSHPTLHNRTVKDLLMGAGDNVIASLTGDGTSLMQMNPAGEWHGLLRPQRTDLGALRLTDGGALLFESGYSGVGNIYSIDTLTLTVKQLTNAPFGASTPSMTTDGKLLFSDYSAAGYKIARLAVNEQSGTDMKFDSPAKFPVAETLSAQESFNIDTLRYPALSPYTDKPYRRGLHLFNIHSWAPFYTNVDYVSGTSYFTHQDVYPGVMLMSQNRLNTMITELAYYYNYHEMSNHGVMSMRYQGWFPVLQLRVDVGGNRESMTGYEMMVPNYKHETRVEIDFSTYFTLDFTNNHYLHGLQPFVGYYYINNILMYPAGGGYGSAGGDFQYLHGGIYYYRYRQLARRDIFPRWGWQAWARYLGHPYLDLGQLFLGKANIYLPGIVRNHGIKLSAAYQYQRMKPGYFFMPRQIIDAPRGTPYYPNNDVMMTGTADYAFGLAYPDLSFGSIAYLTRIRANLFGDFARSHNLYQTSEGQQYVAWDNMYSYGIEMYLDLFFFRLRYAPVALKFTAMNANGKLRGNISLGVTIN